MYEPETGPLFPRSTERTTDRLNRAQRRAIRHHRVALGIATVGIVVAFVAGRVTARPIATPTSTPAKNTPSKAPIVCVQPADEDGNVTAGQLGTPRCVNDCTLTLAGDPDHMISYWTYASVPGYQQYKNHPCPIMPPYAPASN